MKQNLKKAAKIKSNQLYNAYLDATEFTVENWKKSYLSNPFLRQIARLLVWEQAGRFFTLIGDNPIDSEKQPFTLGEEPIKVAHPMEMKQKEIISRRLNNLEFLKESHEIVKYAPQYYDENGVYQKDEWTCFSDIGKEFEGKIITMEDYLDVEDRFISVTRAILEAKKIAEVFGIGIGSGVYPELKEMYGGNYLMVRNVQDLTENFSRQMKTIVNGFKRKM